MAINIQGGRFINRKTDVKDKIPTVSPYENHVSGKWLDTDIYESELYINTNDNRMWFRNNNNQIIEIPTLDINNSKIKDINLPDMFGKLNYVGLWNANTNEYPIGFPQKADYYIVSDNGFVDNIKFIIGDFIVYDGNYWNKIDNYKKPIYTTDIIYDKDIKLNDILSDLSNKSNFEKGIVSKKLSIIDGIDVFKVDIDNITYKNNSIYHNGNSNNIKTDWISNNLLSNKLTTKEIYSDNINADELTSVNISSKNISSKNIKTDSLSIITGRVEFDNGAVILTANGKGIFFNYLRRNIIQYNSFDDYITSYPKIKYDSDKVFDNDLELINKKYVDNKINETLNIDINDLFYNEIIIYKEVKYINIDINVDGNFELLLDKLEKNINSLLITICVDTNNNNNFNLSVKSSSKLLFNINSVGVNSFYFNVKNKKWYKN